MENYDIYCNQKERFALTDLNPFSFHMHQHKNRLRIPIFKFHCETMSTVSQHKIGPLFQHNTGQNNSIQQYPILNICSENLFPSLYP